MARKKRAPPKLSRDKILEAALAIIDVEGVDKFNMRRLARDLDVDPMAIYYHFENKTALMGAIINAMFASFQFPPETGDWRVDVREFLMELRNVAQRHPGAFQFFETFDEWTDGENRLLERLYGLLLAAGFPEEKVVWVRRLLWVYSEVFAFDEVAGWFEEGTAEELLENLPEDGEFPNMRNLATRIVAFHPDEEFDFGLNVLMDGLEQHRGRRPS